MHCEALFFFSFFFCFLFFFSIFTLIRHPLVYPLVHPFVDGFGAAFSVFWIGFFWFLWSCFFFLLASICDLGKKLEGMAR